MDENKMYRLYKRVYSSRTAVRLLRCVSHAASAAAAAAFILMLGFVSYADIRQGVRLAAAAGIPFLTVSVMRHIINSDRPYQVYDFTAFTDLVPKSRGGVSFPSRHVFSVFLIGVLALGCSPLLGAVLLALGVLMAAARVMLGIHFIHDVAAGAAIGMLSGIAGLLIL